MSEARTLRKANTLAPWAEIVPRPGRMTVEDLLKQPDDSWRYELVEGVLVRVAGSGQRATTIAGVIFGLLFAFVRPRRLGIVTPADGVYTFPGAETGLLPDVGFYVAARQALIVDPDKPIPFAPDLAVEVASPSQDAEALAAKARRYLAGGTRLVWVIWPERAQVDIWRAGATAPLRTLAGGDTLDGADVVLGFALPVADIFADPLA
jgi:Uma2 family endonuclease